MFRELSHLYINLTFRMLINMYILKSDENLPLQIMKNYSPPPPPHRPEAPSKCIEMTDSIFYDIIEETVNAKRFLISTAIACFEALFQF